MKDIAIEIKKLKKEYDTHNEKLIIFDNLNMKFEYGKMYGIVGHSGCGKSTLIKLIGMLERPNSGSISINQKDIELLSDDEQANLRNKTIGFIFQDYLLDDCLNVYDNILLPTLKNKVDAHNKILELLDELGIQNRLKHFPKELSGGECQRVAICRALINNPNILLCDEPTGNLDRKNEKFIMEKLKEQSQSGKCVIVVTHSNIINEYADEIINLEESVK